MCVWMNETLARDVDIDESITYRITHHTHENQPGTGVQGARAARRPGNLPTTVRVNSWTIG